MAQITELKNGIRVVTEKMPSVRSVAIGVWIKVGSANESVYNNGISHVIEHMLFKGTTNRTAKQIAEEMSAIGGHMNAFTGKECTCYHAQVLDTHLDVAVDVLSDMIQNSLFNQADLDKEKSVILDEIDMYEDSPEDLVHEMLHKKVWHNHPLGFLISGEKEVVSNITREQILEFMDKHYTAENIVISVAGSFDEASVIEMLDEKFSQTKRNNYIKDTSNLEYNKSFVKIDKDIEQMHICFAYDGIDYNSKDKYVLSIINTILGGSMNSRLFQEIREELGLTYSIYSYISSYNDGGLIQIYAGMNPQYMDTVYDKILEVVNNLRENGINEDELHRTVEQLKSDIIIGLESTNSRMNGNGKALLLRNTITSQDEIIDKLNQITVQQVNDFLKKYFANETISMSLVGNLNQIDIERVEQKWKSL